MITAPFNETRGAGTLYEGGVNVPMIITGPGIAPESTTASLASSADLYATLLELSGRRDHPALVNGGSDAQSLVPVLADNNASVREFVYAELAAPGTEDAAYVRAIRNSRYKLLVDSRTTAQELYDLADDPGEQHNLLGRPLADDARVNYERLQAELGALH
jgi:arylsulfatase A-like enzyme